LERGQFLILAARGSDRYVQFASDGEDGLRAEAVSNRFLQGWQMLDKTAESRLRRLGWRPPTEIGDGPVNWWRSFDSPVPGKEVAELAVATLTKAFDLVRPDEIAYRAFSSDDEVILLPMLGVGRSVDPSAGQGLGRLVDPALRAWLTVDEIVYDSDGDVPIRVGEAVIFVRCDEDRGFAAVFCEVVTGVASSADLLEAVNEINTEIRGARAMVVDIGVMVAAEVEAGPGFEEALGRACDAVAAIANYWAPQLQQRFGGALALGETSPPPPVAGGGVGFYL
jgi:hypothetical protein